MIYKSTRTLLLAFTIASLSTGVQADDIDDFTFSDDLTEAIEEHAEDVAEFNETIEAALEGLTEEEALEVFETYADEAEALRETAAELREESAEELEAAGIEPPEDDRGEPRREQPRGDDDDDEDDGDRSDRGERRGRD